MRIDYLSKHHLSREENIVCIRCPPTTDVPRYIVKVLSSMHQSPWGKGSPIATSLHSDISISVRQHIHHVSRAFLWCVGLRFVDAEIV
jgi:hypothetical protein